jgi:hypothetical protein
VVAILVLTPEEQEILVNAEWHAPRYPRQREMIADDDEDDGIYLGKFRPTS